MKLSSVKRVVQEDFKESDRPIAAAVGNCFNNFADEVVNAMNKKLSVDDNLAMEYKEIIVTIGANGSIGITQFQSNLSNKVRGVTVERAENLTNSSVYPNGAPFVTFVQNNSLIVIKHITGLVPNNKYRLTLLSKS